MAMVAVSLEPFSLMSASMQATRLLLIDSKLLKKDRVGDKGHAGRGASIRNRQSCLSSIHVKTLFHVAASGC